MVLWCDEAGSNSFRPGNKLRKLPKALTRYKASLTTLMIDSVGLTSLPASVFALKNLTRLDAGHNAIEEVCFFFF